jgi:hypothetical protein
MPVGYPFEESPGNRLCEVNGRLLTDGQVITLWWGKELGSRILREGVGSGPESGDEPDE